MTRKDDRIEYDKYINFWKGHAKLSVTFFPDLKIEKIKKKFNNNIGDFKEDS